MKLTSDGFYIRIGANHNQLSNVTKQQMHCSEAILEAKAEWELKKGYNKRNVKCNKCFTLMSVTGECINCN